MNVLTIMDYSTGNIDAYVVSDDVIDNINLWLKQHEYDIDEISYMISDDLKINGVYIKTECKLNSALHRRILDEAVRLAVLSKMPTSNTAQQQ